MTETPNPPAGGFTQDPKYMYCKCGTIMSCVDISINLPGAANIPIARMNRCCACSWVERVYILPGRNGGKSNAELNGLSMRHVAECVRQAPLESYTLDELKTGRLHGFPVKPPADKYDPDAHIQPSMDGIF